jgi:hypothetical protein
MDILAKITKSKFCIFEKTIQYFSRTPVQALEKNIFFFNLSSSGRQLSYGFSSVKKYL